MVIRHFLLHYSFLFILIALQIGCDKDPQLNFLPKAQPPRINLPDIPPQPSPAPSFGVCGKEECTPPFCAENCKTADTCHVRDVDGICRPSCGYAAHLLGYGGYGDDREPSTSDDRHTYKSATSCDELSVPYPDGVVRDDWIQKDFYLDMTPYEVIEGGGVCCMRGLRDEISPEGLNISNFQ